MRHLRTKSVSQMNEKQKKKDKNKSKVCACLSAFTHRNIGRWLQLTQRTRNSAYAHVISRSLLTLFVRNMQIPIEQQRWFLQSSADRGSLHIMCTRSHPDLKVIIMTHSIRASSGECARARGKRWFMLCSFSSVDFCRVIVDVFSLMHILLRRQTCWKYLSSREFWFIIFIFCVLDCTI